MRCYNCSKENADGAKFCKFCGAPIEGDVKTCPNGHNYDAREPDCPFCPGSGNQKTVVESADGQKSAGAQDKTVADTSGPVLKPAASAAGGTDKTVIYSKEDKVKSPASAGQRKLVGWLVTFDLNPIGTDFRLFEGRTKIGRSSKNDIIINDSEISDEHAILLFRNNCFHIQDNLSSNGTFVNGMCIEEKMQLKDNDMVRVGTVNLKIKIIQDR
jgi:hypothetical protein